MLHLFTFLYTLTICIMRKNRKLFIRTLGTTGPMSVHALSMTRPVGPFQVRGALTATGGWENFTNLEGRFRDCLVIFRSGGPPGKIFLRIGGRSEALAEKGPARSKKFFPCGPEQRFKAVAKPPRNVGEFLEYPQWTAPRSFPVVFSMARSAR